MVKKKKKKKNLKFDLKPPKSLGQPDCTPKSHGQCGLASDHLTEIVRQRLLHSESLPHNH